MIIVIDGPAGSGKSSTAKAVAKKLNIAYLDSGALYRALTWLFIREGRDKQVFFDVLKQTSVTFSYRDEVFHVAVNGKDITPQLRSGTVGDLVSKVASLPRSRDFVNKLMRKAVSQGQYIAEGRDLGTAVFPNARLKFFMCADTDERARRRFKELKAKGEQVTVQEVRKNIVARDEQDANRKADPLKKAEDAIELDTTDMSFEDQVQKICKIINDNIVLTNNS